MDPLDPLLRTLTRYLNENELFYAFTGELALRMLGSGEEVRTVELTANLTPDEREKLLNFLEQEGFTKFARTSKASALRGTGRGELRETPPASAGGGIATEHRWRGPVLMRHRLSGPGLRLRLAGSQAELAAIGRRVPATLGFATFFIPATEDLLLDLIDDREVPQEKVISVYLKWRNYLDISYLVAAARSRGIYDRFIKMKIRAEK